MYYPPLPPLKMEIKRLPRMNEGQLKQARKLIQAKCCNYDNGHCLALDDGIDDRCPQWHTYSLLCKWFHKAVLPNNPPLHEKLIDLSATHKRCVICNRFFLPTGPRSKYCSQCALQQRRKYTRDRVRRHRGRV